MFSLIIPCTDCQKLYSRLQTETQLGISLRNSPHFKWTVSLEYIATFYQLANGNIRVGHFWWGSLKLKYKKLDCNACLLLQTRLNPHAEMAEAALENQTECHTYLRAVNIPLKPMELKAAQQWHYSSSLQLDARCQEENFLLPEEKVGSS